VAKDRIDVVMAKLGLAPSREKAKLFVMAGETYVDGERVTKPDRLVPYDTCIEVKSNPIPYVSFGGVKLEAALKVFGVIVTGKKALDIGSSTGGFVDCLLQRGASCVIAVDVGTHQLHEKLRQDKRVLVHENLNARYLTIEDIGDKVDIVTIDVSFISLRKILPAVIPLLNPGGCVVSLLKPQFEVDRSDVGKGGIVRDHEKIERVIRDIKTYGITIGVRPVHEVEAPRERSKKNKEYFILWELLEPRNLSSFLPA